jgi:NTP pyrophosphatase (non-canonical NTP hydrolase)
MEFQCTHKVINQIVEWHKDRNLIEGSTEKDQVLKLIQEVGELSDNVCKGKDIRDDVGDILVILINIAERRGVSLKECMQVAYEDIKDRTGAMKDGIFIKNQ